MIRLLPAGSRLSIIGSILLCSPALAETYTFETPDDASRGWHRSDGLHTSGNNNYLVGGYIDSYYYRNYFVFELNGIAASETIVSATLELFNPRDGFSSSDPFELYQLYSIDSASIAALKGSSDDLSVYNDLGTGVAYSSEIAVSEADSDTTIAIPLNAAFLSYAQASIGGTIAVGGAITSLDGIVGNNELVFAGSHLHPLSGTRLVVTTVPEPAAATMLALALGAIASVRTAARGCRVVTGAGNA